MYEPQLISAKIIPTYVTHAPSVRPLQMTADDHTLNSFAEATEGGRDTSASAMARVAPNLLGYGSSLGEAGIAGTFKTRRYAVMLEFRTEFPNSAYETEVFIGYTNMIETSLSGHVDMGTAISFNKHIRYRSLVTRAVSGMLSNKVTGVGVNNILTPVHCRAVNDHGPGQQLTTFARPLDVVSHAYNISSPQYQQLQEGTRMAMELEGLDYQPIPVRDRTNPIRSGFTLARNSDRVGTHYLSHVVTALNSGRAMANDYGDLSPSNPLVGNIRSSLKGEQNDLNLASNLMSKLIQSTNYNQTHEITLSELGAAFPELFHLLRNGDVVEAVGDNIDYTSYSNHNQGLDNTSRAANDVVQVVSEAMGTNLILNQSFKMDNWSDALNPGGVSIVPTGEHRFMLPNGAPQHLKDSYYVQNLERIKQTLDSMLRVYCQVYTIEVRASILGLMAVEVTLDDAIKATPFTLPAYCDQLYTGVVQSSQMALTDMAMGFNSMFDALNNPVPQGGFY